MAFFLRLLSLISRRYNRLMLRPSSRLNAALLMSLGRSGSTWLMRVLSEHPFLVADNKFPYENRVAQYWVHLKSVLETPADQDKTVDPNIFYSQMDKVFKNPFYSSQYSGQVWFREDYPKFLNHFAAECINSFYYTLAEQQSKPRPMFFIEKSGPGNESFQSFPDIFSNFKSIFLIRDFRDVYVSVRAYNKKFGGNDFGRKFVENEYEYIRLLEQSARKLAEFWEHETSKSYLLHYEDLISHPQEMVANILNYLGLDSRLEIITDMLKRASNDDVELNTHRTCSEIQKTSKRWQIELEPELLELCNEVFGDVLQKFGYRVEK